MARSRRISVASIILTAISCAHAQQDVSSRLDRLETLADVWGKLYIYHPSIVTSKLDWNRVLLEAIPRIERAQSAAEVVAVLNASVMRPLNDPLLYTQLTEDPRSIPPKPFSAHKLSARIGYIDASDWRMYADRQFLNRISMSLRDFGDIEKLIVDLRFPSIDPRSHRRASMSLNWLGFFARSAITTSPSLRRLHQGWNELNEPNVYSQGWQSGGSWTLYPIQQADYFTRGRYPGTAFDQLQATKANVVFLVNNASYAFFAPVLDALQSQAHSVVWERTGPLRQAAREGETTLMQYPGGIEVHFDPVLLLSYSGKIGIQPDRISNVPITDDLLPELANQTSRPSRANWNTQPAGLPTLHFPPPEPVSTTSLTREQRLLGLFKLWVVIKHFSPHLQFASVNWETTLRDWIPRVEAAQTLKQYYKIVAQLTANLNDGHVRIQHSVADAPQEYFGIFFRHLYGRYTVADSLVEGASPGDELIAVNGRPVKDVEQEWRSYKSASTEQQMWMYLQQAASGRQWFDETMEREFTLKSSGREKIVRAKASRTAIPPTPTLEVSHERLPGDIAYIRLYRISSMTAFNEALKSLWDAKGLILDLRSNAPFPVNAITSRLFDRPILTQREIVPVSAGFDRSTRSWKEVDISFEPSGDTYRKPVVVIISAALGSAPENFCMDLKYTRRATLVGATGTSGYSGNVAFIHLPGGAVLFFTGMRCVYADGSQFQNIGVLPDVEVKPTIKDIAERTDVALPKAIETLQRLITGGASR